jgi:L,D-transpeptidase-like protein
MLALSGAAAVTALTFGGALGLIPGAALGETTRDGDRSESPDPEVATQSTDRGSSDSTGGQGAGSDWLTIDPKADSEKAGGQQSGAPTSAEDEALPADSGDGKRIVFDISDQRVWLVGSADDVRRTYLVSGSLHDNLTPDTYEVYSKSRHAVSFDSQETMNFMVRFAHGDRSPIGFHDIPAYDDGTLAQTKAELGTPQSAGCIRQWKPDAAALWKFAPVGTTVVVLA